jgi:hypothetical protein
VRGEDDPLHLGVGVGLGELVLHPLHLELLLVLGELVLVGVEREDQETVIAQLVPFLALDRGETLEIVAQGLAFVAEIVVISERGKVGDPALAQERVLGVEPPPLRAIAAAPHEVAGREHEVGLLVGELARDGLTLAARVLAKELARVVVPRVAVNDEEARLVADRAGIGGGGLGLARAGRDRGEERDRERLRKCFHRTLLGE